MGLRGRVFEVRKNLLRFIRERSTGKVGEYHYSSVGVCNLYSSCYALMTLYYLDALPKNRSTLDEWGKYINDWQQADGRFLGPELLSQLPNDSKHDLEHISLHLASTVLPCLDILGCKPRYPLVFAHRFVEQEFLSEWLSKRDWKDAWLEGNNILFVMQILVYLRDVERVPNANDALKQVFDWLSEEVDSATGLWGTDGKCSPFVAMCGGYHQLLVYYYTNTPVLYPKELIDTTLALQHEDGGFSPHGGGGACEDVDAVDILVNLYKRCDYRRAEIRVALRKALRSILTMQMPDGGFVYRRGEEFSHMGMPLTRTPPDSSNMFSTWFRAHTVALISEVLARGGADAMGLKFNPTLSMGWHDATRIAAPVGDSLSSKIEEFRSVGLKRWLKAQISYAWLLKWRTIAWAK